MNFLWRIKFAIDNSIKAFHAFVLNKSVRWYNLPNPEYRQFRYPSPGSEPIFHSLNDVNYKVAYRESPHHIRYDPEKEIHFESIYLRDPLGESIEQKLHKYGYLQKVGNNSAQTIDVAKVNYQKNLGESADVRVHQDDFDMPTLNTREAMTQFVREEFMAIKKINEKESYTDTLEDFYRPHFHIMRNYDYSCDDPVHRQNKVEIEYQLELWMELRKKAGEMKVFRGDPNFWLILDNSFAPENIRQVQTIVRDTVSHLEPGYLEKSQNTVANHRQETLKFPIKSNFIE